MKKNRPRGACGRPLPDMAARPVRPSRAWQPRDQRQPPRQRPKPAPSARLAHLLHSIGGKG